MCKQGESGSRFSFNRGWIFYTAVLIISNILMLAFLIYNCIIYPISDTQKNTVVPAPGVSAYVALISCHILIAAHVIKIGNGIFLQYALSKSSPKILLIWIIIQIINATMSILGAVLYCILAGRSHMLIFMGITILIESMDVCYIWTIWRLRHRIIKTLAFKDMLEESGEDEDEDGDDDDGEDQDQKDQDMVDVDLNLNRGNDTESAKNLN